MKTQRLYYNDSYTTTFNAKIIDRLTAHGYPAVTLDQTYFYPTGGGQPHDTGQIGGIDVVDVIARDDDGMILHILADEIQDSEAECVVNWERRFDFMQHHTGQHILTRSFEQVAGAHTTSFHLSEESVTIDLDASNIATEIIDQVEDLANQIIYENRPVSARIVDPDQLDNIRIRKLPDVLTTDGLRVIEVEDFDSTACGGTHVAHTGEIGQIKIMGQTRRGDQMRIEFLCGWRALRALRSRSRVVSQLAVSMTVGYQELDQVVARMQDELRTTRQALKAATDRLLEVEATELLASAQIVNGRRFVIAVFEQRDSGELRSLANALISTTDTVVLLGIPGEKCHVIAARHIATSGDMAFVLKHVLSQLGSDRGGGKPEFAQGGGVPADRDTLQSALEAVATLLSNPA